MHTQRIPRDGDTVLLRLGGIVTDNNNAELDGAVLKADEYGQRILISLRDVNLLNSSGIGMLLAVNRRVQGKGGKLVLIDIPLNVRQVFDFMKLGGVFQIADTEQQAVEMLQ